MYKKTEYKAGSYRVIRISRANGAFFEVIPELGAMVYRIGLIDKDGGLLDILSYDTPEDLEINPFFRGRFLFPFNDRIPEGRYSYKGISYSLPVNEKSDGSSIHGLIYNKPFTIDDCTLSAEEGSIQLSYSIDADQWDSYPFSVLFTVILSLSEDGFQISFRFENRGEHSAPVALGWHPYFTLDGKADSWNLCCGGGDYVAVDESLNPTGEILPVRGSGLDYQKPKIIGNSELDIALTASARGHSSISDGRRTLNLTFDTGLFPYCQLFIPPQRDAIAIEPITAATNAFNIDGLGLIDLKPGESREGLVRIYLSR